MTEKRTEELVERAVRLHRMGYNCAQSVACALSEEVGVDENMQETCGAVSGAVAALGFSNSIGTQSPSTKASTYGLVRQVREQFLQKNGSTVCSELKGLTGGSMLRSCPGCIEDAVRIACSLMKDADGQP